MVARPSRTGSKGGKGPLCFPPLRRQCTAFQKGKTPHQFPALQKGKIPNQFPQGLKGRFRPFYHPLFAFPPRLATFFKRPTKRGRSTVGPFAMAARFDFFYFAFFWTLYDIQFRVCITTTTPSPLPPLQPNPNPARQP